MSQSKLILEKMQTSGCRITPAKKKLLQILLKAGAPMKVSEIQEHMGLEAGFNVVTLYRNLQLMEELQIVRKIQLNEGYARFELAEPWRGHHHHLVCNSCGTVVDLPSCGLHAMLQEIRDRFGFSVEQHTLDFYGKCAACKAS